jgi:hypothetical protein
MEFGSHHPYHPKGIEVLLVWIFMGCSASSLMVNFRMTREVA